MIIDELNTARNARYEAEIVAANNAFEVAKGNMQMASQQHTAAREKQRVLYERLGLNQELHAIVMDDMKNADGSIATPAGAVVSRKDGSRYAPPPPPVKLTKEQEFALARSAARAELETREHPSAHEKARALATFDDATKRSALALSASLKAREKTTETEPKSNGAIPSAPPPGDVIAPS